MKSMTIIGCGKLGKTIGRLLKDNSGVRIEQVMNRSNFSTLEAISFLGEGHLASKESDLIPVDIILIGVGDSNIKATIELLRNSAAIRNGTIVFHCSGAIPSSILDPLRIGGAKNASIHPVKSFVDPHSSLDTFRGTYCGWEGDLEAVEIINPLFEKCGAVMFKVAPEHKLLYHSGTVFISNYLTALIEAGLRCYEKAGIDRDLGISIMKPIMDETIGNNYKYGPKNALTGPVARGDSALVENQLKALQEWNNNITNLYKSLGLLATDLSKAQGNASDNDLSEIKTILETKR